LPYFSLLFSKCFRFPRGLSATLEEEYFHHEGEKDTKIGNEIEFLKNILFLRAFRVLRGGIHFLLVAALPRQLCDSAQNRPAVCPFSRFNV
jgi:hypothetical protein